MPTTEKHTPAAKSPKDQEAREREVRDMATAPEPESDKNRDTRRELLFQIMEKREKINADFKDIREMEHQLRALGAVGEYTPCPECVDTDKIAAPFRPPSLIDEIGPVIQAAVAAIREVNEDKSAGLNISEVVDRLRIMVLEHDEQLKGFVNQRLDDIFGRIRALEQANKDRTRQDFYGPLQKPVK